MRILLALLLLCCVEPPTPQVNWYKTQDYTIDWFADGPDIKVEVVNPLDVPVEVVFACAAEPKPLEYTVQVAPHTAFRGLAQVMNKYLVGTPCWRKSWRELP